MEIKIVYLVYRTDPWHSLNSRELVYIVKALGATDEQVSKNYLRGFIQEYEMDGDTIRIEAEEAWGATGMQLRKKGTAGPTTLPQYKKENDTRRLFSAVCGHPRKGGQGFERNHAQPYGQRISLGS